MFNTCLHFAIYAYQFKLGPCIVNIPCNVNAVLGCPHLDFVLFMPDIISVQLNLLNKQKLLIFFCTTIFL